MVLFGLNCYGLFDYLYGVVLWLVVYGGWWVEWGVVVLMQSGNFVYNLLMSDCLLLVVYMVLVGNQVQLGIVELMDVLFDELWVIVIGLYLEGLKNVLGFVCVVYKVLQKGVLVIVLKIGVLEIGVVFVFSYISFLVGFDVFYDSLFECFGVICVSGLVSFVEIFKVVVCGYLFGGLSLVVLVCFGGDVGLIVDYVECNGLGLLFFDVEQCDELVGVLFDYVNIVNLLDFIIVIWGDVVVLEEMFDSVLCSFVDVVLLVFDYLGEEIGEWLQCDLFL